MVVALEMSATGHQHNDLVRETIAAICTPEDYYEKVIFESGAPASG